MNAAFLLMSSVALTGADVAPAAPAPAPVVISSGAGCSNCGAPAVAAAPCGDCGKTKIGLLDKIKGRFAGIGKKSHDCGCAPVVVAAPAPCDTCGHAAAAPRPNLFDKLKSRMGHKKGHACGPVCDPCGAAHLMDAPCATPGAPVTPPTTGTPTTTPPKEMPKPKDTPKEAPKDKPKGDTALPVPPVTGASGLTGAGNPY